MPADTVVGDDGNGHHLGVGAVQTRADAAQLPLPGQSTGGSGLSLSSKAMLADAHAPEAGTFFQNIEFLNNMLEFFEKIA